MEYPDLNLAGVSLLTLISILVLLHRRHAASKKHSAPLPPSPPGIPLLGNLHQLGSLPHRSLRDLSNKHGPLMLIHLGHVPALVVSSPDAAMEIMKTHDLIFASRPSLKVAHEVMYGSTDVALSPYGDYWRSVRKLCVTQLLSSKMVQSFRRNREEEVALMIDAIHSQSSNVINMSEVLHTFTNDLICRAVSGKFSLQGRRNVLFRELTEEFSSLFGAFNVGDYFPYLGWMDAFFGLSARARRHSLQWDLFLEEVIEGHAYRKKGADSDNMDFVDVLLSFKKDFQLTRDNIKAILVDMFFAGTDTTYITLEWALAELVRNAEAMKKLQDEVQGVVGEKSVISEGDLTKMHYMKCVLKEVFRLHPAGTLLIQHESTEECEILGYKIPNKTRVITNAWAIGRDPKLWETSEEFRPERFIGSSVDFRGNDFQLIPFGAGRGICPGINFAMASIDLALANLIHHYDWELPAGTPRENFDMTEHFGLATRKNLKLDLLAKSKSS